MKKITISKDALKEMLEKEYGEFDFDLIEITYNNQDIERFDVRNNANFSIIIEIDA